MSETEENLALDQISFRLPKELKNRFLGKIKLHGGNATRILTDFVRRYVGGDESEPLSAPCEGDLSRRDESLVAELVYILNNAEIPENRLAAKYLRLILRELGERRTSEQHRKPGL